ncbi:poly [ADP-ribose] polymerase 2 isoform X1 [Danio rerio]|uniref:Poly [ADP-ribose] polymerase n=2 Tax=Danio rerio TaxID=7955 RepID=A0A8M9QIR2_DANRE|nr:poly [ADP-ribose] polymerase 2 isoform X1 [Danio rerio]XP_021334005.1 poly [ADP-ribose] polymerase 2 isoform X1 [Danio rerio]|eukprot:XP_021334004.1 poly [ADP-ribose] polymerase 2 isoform X1 [Danio rerio]
MRRTRSCRDKSVADSGSEASEAKTVWQWKGDEDEWEPYPSEVCEQLDAAKQAGEKSVSLALGPGYVVDLVKMTQTNTVSKYKRKIRLQKVKSEDLNEGNALNGNKKATGVVQIKEEKEEEEEQPVSKKRRNEGRSQKANKDKPVVKEECEVVKTLVMKGKAPVDPECKAKLGKAHVYNEGADVYDVMLNQTNLQFNNNKYYLIQLLEDDSAKAYSVWLRWGRVGKVGQNNLVSCGANLAQAKDTFKKKFFDKTKNEWEHRASFEKVAGKYDMVFMDYSTEDKGEEKAVVPSATQKKPCQLNSKVQSLLELICDLKAMEECVLEMKFDTKKAPLGKLTAEQIRAGYASLKRIEECLKKKGSNKELLDACNQFYTRIPHDFGLRTPPIIRSEEELKEKITLLETLSDIQIAVKMVQSNVKSDEHPLDRQYHSLNCQLQPLDTDSNEYKVIEKYLKSTHAPTHTDYTMTLLDVFAVEREVEKDNFNSELQNRMLLWHGSRLSNWVGILSQGLRVAPAEAPVTGYMFGKGIYFADMSSKSANYCFASQKNNQGLLLLSEVALGDSNELLDADYNADQLPSGKHSTKGLGQTAPDPKKSVSLNGVTVPLGPSVKTGVGQKGGYSLLYNEYIVYNPAQIQMKYLLRVQFNFSSLW